MIILNLLITSANIRTELRRKKIKARSKIVKSMILKPYERIRS